MRGAQDLEAGSEGIRGEAVPGSDAEGGAALWPWGAGRVRVAGVELQGGSALCLLSAVEHGKGAEAGATPAEHVEGGRIPRPWGTCRGLKEQRQRWVHSALEGDVTHPVTNRGGGALVSSLLFPLRPGPKEMS